MKKPNCFKCIHRRNIAGSTHIECHHPANGEIHRNALARLSAILASVGREVPQVFLPPSLNIEINNYGVGKGWCNYPFNFDPTWIESCEGFESKNDNNYPYYRECQNGKKCSECQIEERCAENCNTNDGCASCKFRFQCKTTRKNQSGVNY